MIEHGIFTTDGAGPWVKNHDRKSNDSEQFMAVNDVKYTCRSKYRYSEYEYNISVH